MAISTPTRARPLVYLLHQEPLWRHELGSWLSDEFTLYSSLLDGDGNVGRDAATGPAEGVICAVEQLTTSHISALQRWGVLGDGSAMPLFVCTESVPPELREELFECGVRDLILWPCSARELRARIRNGMQLAPCPRESSREVTKTAELTDLEDHRRALVRSVQEMRIARDVAERASSVKSNFLRMMSHELRTPIAAMQLQFRLLEREGLEQLDGRQRDHLDRISRSTRRLIDLVNTILEYARIESGRFRPTVSCFELHPVLDEAVRGFTAHAKQKSLEISVVTQSSEPLSPLCSDLDVVRLIAVNLLSNAVQHTENGLIEVGAEQAAERHVLWVRDSGPGIPLARQAEVFEPFQNFRDIRQIQGSGSGLGLAIVRDMVKALGGEIVLRSEVGLGSEFRVSLPTLSTPDAQPGDAGPPAHS